MKNILKLILILAVIAAFFVSALKTTAAYNTEFAGDTENECLETVKKTMGQARTADAAPIEISVAYLRERTVAFQKLSPSDFSVSVLYDNGWVEMLSNGEFSIEYPYGEISVKNNAVIISARGLSKELRLNVEKADFDMSGVYWSEGSFVYDGEEKCIFLNGLADGLAVSEYVGNGAVDAGRYEVIPCFSFDSENYNAPTAENGVLIIKKCTVKPPEIESVYYSGKYVEPKVKNGEFYNYSKNLYRDASLYSVDFEIKDFKNYAIEGMEGSRLRLFFAIKPKIISVEVEKREVYLFENLGEPSYRILEEPFAGDELPLAFYEKDGKTLCKTDNANYKIEVLGGEIVYINRPNSSDALLIFSISLIFLSSLLLILILIFKRDRLRRFLALCSLKRKNRLRNRYELYCMNLKHNVHGETQTPNAETDSDFLPENQIASAEPSEQVLQDTDESFECGEMYEDENTRLCKEESFSDSDNDSYLIFSAVDVDEAEALISDEMAKTLLRRRGAVRSFGKKRGIVNLDALSSAFMPNSEIDINGMKAKGLVSEECFSVKVLARGAIDKPLLIYANDFSLSAIKMIALAGGEAVKVRSEKVKLRGNPDE